MNKESNIATLTENDNQELLQQIVAQIDTSMKKREANLEETRDRMKQVELEWDENLEILLVKIGSIKVGSNSYSCDWKDALSDTSIKRSILKNSQLEKRTSKLGFYLLTLQELFKKQEFQFKCLEIGERSTESPHEKEKVILIVGETGSGKTTLINSMINYVFGVEYEDEFRFKLPTENDANSESSYLVAYTIHHQNGFNVPYTLTIIDTPGFGKKIQRDIEIAKQIHNFFKDHMDEGIDHIDAVGIVAKSSLPRLTFTQKYIFDKILSLFGKDIGENIYLMLTFADGKVPQVLNEINETHMPYQEFFKFNNSAIFEDNTAEDEFAIMLWKMGMKSFEKFFNNLSGKVSKSLMQTESVLEERERNEIQINQLQSEIERGLNKLDELKKEVEVVEKHKADLNRNKDFTYTVEEEYIIRQNMDPGSYVINCDNCNSTCHNPSPISDDGDLYHSAAMDKPGKLTAKCTVCRDNCSWHNHKSLDYYFITERKQIIKTSEDIKTRYLDASEKVNSVTAIIEKKVDEFESIQISINGITEVIHKSINTLNEIALEPNPLSTGEYILNLIEFEKSAAEPGWQDRINHLNEVKEKVDTLAAVAKEGYDPFEAFKLKLKEEKDAKEVCSAICNYLQRIQSDS